MPQQQSPMVLQQPKQKSGGGGILRSILRPFMPEVAAGIDAADGVLTALRGGDGSDGIAQAAKMLQSGLGGEEDDEEAAGEPGTVEVPDNPLLAMSHGAEEEGEGDDSGENEADEFNPAELESLNKIASAFPEWDSELSQEPQLLDGVMGLASKLKNHYRRQAEGMA